MENCTICGQLCTPALYRRKPDETTEALCQKCAEKWLEGDTDFPQQPYITIYILRKVSPTR